MYVSYWQSDLSLQAVIATFGFFVDLTSLHQHINCSHKIIADHLLSCARRLLENFDFFLRYYMYGRQLPSTNSSQALT